MGATLDQLQKTTREQFAGIEIGGDLNKQQDELCGGATALKAQWLTASPAVQAQYQKWVTESASSFPAVKAFVPWAASGKTCFDYVSTVAATQAKQPTLTAEVAFERFEQSYRDAVSTRTIGTQQETQDSIRTALRRRYQEVKPEERPAFRQMVMNTYGAATADKAKATDPLSKTKNQVLPNQIQKMCNEDLNFLPGARPLAVAKAELRGAFESAMKNGTIDTPKEQKRLGEYWRLLSISVTLEPGQTPDKINAALKRELQACVKNINDLHTPAVIDSLDPRAGA